MKKITLEEIKNKDRFLLKTDFVEKKLDSAIAAALKKVDFLMECMEEQFPGSNTHNNMYEQNPNNGDWTRGFWPGILWLSYELTGDEKYRDLATKLLPTFTKRIVERIGIETHDMGFLFTLSCVSAYKLTGNEEGKKSALMAAEHLSTRYQEKGEFIQAWGTVNDPLSYRLIIDCLLNLPLLYWASEVTGDSKYKELAYKHYRTTIQNAVREDASTHHTFYFDPETGAPLRGATKQGASDDSTWARGQAWGIYGSMLTSGYINDPDAVEVCKKLTNHFLNRLPKDYIPYWDMIYNDGSGEPRDSSSAAISVCGILELIKFMTDGEEKDFYKNAALIIMESLYDNYSSKDTPDCNGILMHGVYNRKTNLGVDECNIWGDYFYLEALTRLKTNWKLYW